MRYKYPRTPHLPWSPGATSDDVRLLQADAFAGQDVVVTEKMDGENTTLYRDTLHARSVDGRFHPSRAWVKALHGRISYRIAPGWRICGENLYARHSIAYPALPSYFMAFSVWNADNRCLGWDDTLRFVAALEIPTPPVLYRGPWDEARIRRLSIDRGRQEGYVVRLAGGFDWNDFGCSIAKWVRPNHVTSHEHWMHQAVVPNGLAGDRHED